MTHCHTDGPVRDSSEYSSEQEYSDSDNSIGEETEVEHDASLANIVAAVDVNKSLEVDGEFVNNPMSFNADKSWLATYNTVDLANESQFAKHGPTNVNGDWKGLMFSNKKALSRVVEEWHVIHFVQMKDLPLYLYLCSK